MGIIPACAGSTPFSSGSMVTFRDHPRMCGEHLKPCARWEASPGSSPHVRGALIHHLVMRHADGIIPACAGSTWASTSALWHHRDHPRMCGEHDIDFNTLPTDTGSSPHVRGARRLWHLEEDAEGIIPACAGSTPISCVFSVAAWDHPRMCGEHL